MNYNTKDIFLERATANETFEEYILRTQQNGVVVTDAYGNLVIVSTASFWQGSFPTSSISLTPTSASYASQADNAATASYAVSASYEIIFETSASHAEEADDAISASYVPNLYPQEYLPSASWASASISASYAGNVPDTSSYANQALSASWAPMPVVPESVASASWASASISASYAGNVPDTASYANQALSASWAPMPVVPESVASASWASSSISASYAANADRAISASYAPDMGIAVNAETASYVTSSGVHGTVGFAESASWVPNLYPQTEQISASWASASISASYAANVPDTASYANQALSASWAPMPVIPSTDSASWASASVSASHADNSDRAISASYAPISGVITNAESASYVLNAVSASYAPSSVPATASFATTASHALALGQLSQSIIPSADNVFDLGSETRLWHHLYLGSSSLYVGGIPITVSGSEMLVDGSPIITTNTFTDNSIRLYLTASSTSSNSAPLKFSSGPLMLNSEAGAIEFYYDDYYASITSVATPSSWTSIYPPAQNGTFVRATSINASNVQAYYCTDPAKSLIGSDADNSWEGTPVNRLHIDLGTGSIIQRIYLENGHGNGYNTQEGVRAFTFWGTNDASAFATLTYATDTNWTQLSTDIPEFRQHVFGVDASDPQYAVVNNNAAYRYYAFKVVSGWSNFLTIRRIELQVGNYIGGDRKRIVLTDGPSLGVGTVPFATTNGRLSSSNAMKFDGTTLTASGVTATSMFQLPYSASTVALTPLVFTGSSYVDVTNKLFYVYSGTNWMSSSLA